MINALLTAKGHFDALIQGMYTQCTKHSNSSGAGFCVIDSSEL